MQQEVDETYVENIVSIAIEKLKKVGKPITGLELSRNIVSALKKKYGKNDKRHTSKIRFRKEILPIVFSKDQWTDKIVSLGNKKFELFEPKTDGSKLVREQTSFEGAKDLLSSLIERMNPYKLEELVKILIEKRFGYIARVTKKSGDNGIDIIAEKSDRDSAVKEHKRLMLVQVKQCSGSIDRPKADQFVGVVEDYGKGWSSVTGLFVTTGVFTKSFEQKLTLREKTGFNYCFWNGEILVRYMLEHGIGLQYTLDSNFWNKLDPSILEKSVKK